MKVVSVPRLTRPKFLLIATVLLGCGGGGSLITPPADSGGGADLLKTGLVSGQFALTDLTRSRAATTSYKITTPLGSSPIGADGSFSVKSITTSPTPAIVTDNTGAVVSFAYIDSTNRNITNADVARSMSMLSLRAKNLDPTLRKRLWTSLKSATEVSALSSSFASLGGHLTGAQADLINRQSTHLQPIVNSLKGSGNRGIVVDPAEGGSGVSVLQTGLNQAYAQNSARRRTWVFVDRIEVKAADGTVSPRMDSITDFALGQVSNPQNINSALADAGTVLGDQYAGGNPAYTGNVAWVPVQSAPLTLEVLPSDAIYTKYRFMVVGPGSTKNAPASLREEWKAKRTSLLVESFVMDLMLPWISLATGPLGEKALGADKLTDPRFVLALSGLKDVVNAAIATPSINAQIDSGDYAGAWQSLMNYALGSEAFGRARDQIATYLFAQAMEAAGENFDDAVFGDFMKSIGGLMSKVDLALQGFDTAVVVKNWATADAYLPFNVTVTNAKVKLSPQSAKLSFKSTVDLQATVPDATGDEAPYIQYNFTMTGQNSQYFTNITSGANGTSMSSSNGAVRVTSPDRQTATIDVTVEAIVKKPGEADRSLGKANAKVKVVNDKAVLYPAKSSIKPNASQNFEVRVNNVGATSQYMFKWKTTGTVGKLSSTTSEPSANPNATYTANGSTGQDTVTVDVYQQSDQGLVFLTTAKATIKVEEEPLIIPATYSPIISDTGYGCLAVVQFTPIPGYTKYALYGEGGFDANYYGESILVTSGAKSILSNGAGDVNLGGNLGWGLSGASGAQPGPWDSYLKWFDGRFKAFSFYVVASK